MERCGAPAPGSSEGDGSGGPVRWLGAALGRHPVLTERHLLPVPETEPDISALRDLYIRHRWHEFAPLPWDDVAKRALLSQQFDIQRQQYRTAFPDRSFMVLRDGDGVAGRFYLGGGMAGAQDAGGVHIVDILLAPERRGRGIGTALLSALLAEAEGRGMGVSLMVDKFNPARALYRRLGFHITGDEGIGWRMEWHADGGRAGTGPR